MKTSKILRIALLMAVAGTMSAQTPTVLYNFTHNENPRGSLTLSGNVLYGMATDGGANGVGYIFSINTDGSGFRDIWDFDDTGSARNANGAYPNGSLIINGHKLYGMTNAGGANNERGVVFSINTDGSGYKDLWDLSADSGGSDPFGSLLMVNNKLYAMAYSGGWGTMFSIDTSGGAFDSLCFATCNHGESPYGSLSISGGTLFGLTNYGGVYGQGNIISIDTNGTDSRDLYDLSNPLGSDPYGSLTISASGTKMFGTAADNGGTSYYRAGAVFSVDTDGNNYKVLLSFTDTGSYGASPMGDLTLLGNKLYGMASSGGTHNMGTIFSIDTDGSQATCLYNFDSVHGENPNFGAPVISNGVMYGMTENGGTGGHGVIFKFDIGPSSVNNLPANTATVKVYPNPNNGRFVIQTLNNKQEAMNVEVYNTLGQQIYCSLPIVNYQLSIDLSNQPGGVYFYRVLTLDGSVVGQGKLVVQK